MKDLVHTRTTAAHNLHSLYYWFCCLFATSRSEVAFSRSFPSRVASFYVEAGFSIPSILLGTLDRRKRESEGVVDEDLQSTIWREHAARAINLQQQHLKAHH